MARIYQLVREHWVPAPLDQVFQFFSAADNLQQLTPPWLNFHILERPDQLKKGSLIHYALRVRGLPIRWTSKITEWNPPHSFVDEQIRGPYTLWHHEHRFTPQRGGTLVEDRVDYSIPLGIFGSIANWALVAKDLERIFDYRREKMQQIFGS